VSGSAGFTGSLAVRSLVSCGGRVAASCSTDCSQRLADLDGRVEVVPADSTEFRECGMSLPDENCSDDFGISLVSQARNGGSPGCPVLAIVSLDSSIDLDNPAPHRDD
jgi:hypothetical protein